MIKNELLTKVLGFGIFYRWHPAVALRYLPFVDWIKTRGKASKILEVGSGGLGIAPYLKREVTGVDIEFRLPFHPLLERVRASVINLPFADSSYDFVVSVDMLEHLEKEQRNKAISEMVRVARQGVLVGVPSGKEAGKEDILLNEYYKNKFGEKYQFFEEQIKEELPEKEDLRKMIVIAGEKLNKKITMKIEGNENIAIHRFLMKGWMTKNLLLDFFYRKILLFVLPLLRALNKPPYYRQLFFVEIKP